MIEVTVPSITAPTITVKMSANGLVDPQTPVVLKTVQFDNTTLDISNELAAVANTANNLANEAYANAVAYTNLEDEVEDGGTF